MHSVADDLRHERMQALASLTVSERIELALRLGEDDVRLYCQVHQVDQQVARRVFARAKAAGRPRSILTL
jgi:hypothetical protein